MKYLFPITYFRAVEKNLPDKTDFERMITSKNFEKALMVLQDTLYAPFISKDSFSSVEEIIEKEEGVFQKNLSRIGVPQKIIDFLFLKADIFNLSLILKKEIFGIEYSAEEMINISTSDVPALKDKYSSLIEELKNNHPQNAIEIDEKLTEFYFKEAIKRSKKLKEKELKEFFLSYWRVIKKGGKEDIAKNLQELEERFKERNKWKIEGLAPFFVFFLKRKAAQKKLKSILAGKQINLETEEINKLTENLPSLI